MSLTKIEKSWLIGQVKETVANDVKEFNSGARKYINRVMSTHAAQSTIVFASVFATMNTAIAIMPLINGQASPAQLLASYVFSMKAAAAMSFVWNGAMSVISKGTLDKAYGISDKAISSLEEEIKKIKPDITKKELGELFKLGAKEITTEIKQANAIPGGSQFINKTIGDIQEMMDMHSKELIKQGQRDDIKELKARDVSLER